MSKLLPLHVLASGSAGKRSTSLGFTDIYKYEDVIDWKAEQKLKYFQPMLTFWLSGIPPTLNTLLLTALCRASSEACDMQEQPTEVGCNWQKRIPVYRSWSFPQSSTLGRV